MPINDFSHHQLTWYPDKTKLKRPLYRSLLKQLTSAINNGQLKPGTQLPPQRELADFLDINFTTVTRTYKLSAQYGLTYGIHGKGTFVSSNGIDPLTVNTKRLPMIELGFVASFEQTNHLLDGIIKQTVKEGASQLLTYDDPTGRLVDKEAFLEYLNWLGISLNTSQRVIVTPGGENSLTLLLMTMFSSGDRIAVDEFTYGNLIATAQLNNIHLVAVQNDHLGMIPDQLEKACLNNHLAGIYLMPEYSNPLGITMPIARRQKLAAIMKKHHLKVIEDDYMSFLTKFNPDHPVKLMQLLPQQTFYVCSMSKVVASGLRISYLVFPRQFQSQVENGFFNTMVKTSTLNSAIATNIIKQGLVYQIIDHKLSLAKQANHIFDQIYGQSSPNEITELAYFRNLPVSARSEGQDIEADLLKKGIRCFSSKRFKVNAGNQHDFLRVSLSGTKSMNELSRGLKLLQQYLEQNCLI
ncbi:PLP-dependent aminotransferase family protein [uncultured Limosilactobacillus sp.]|uniref:aminotransferase-like domain-containing protein n=1 Tax=uncultured Limosilactobacillus sp. TaxID=2837629 RepID=UPI0025D57AAE|nr:PLP-dependent aminotransferase family protein [uncultured Limosilactobacillus sp.]